MTDMITLDLNDLPAVSLGDHEAFEDASKGGDFLPRLQLFSKGNLVNAGKIAPGHWGIPITDGEVITLGKTVDIIPLARRLKALDMSDRNDIVAVYDHKSETYKRIAAAAGEADSGCMCGPSFLVFERTQGKFLEYFCGNTSSRIEAKNLYDYLPITQAEIEARGPAGEGLEPHGPVPATLSIQLKTGKHSYHVPKVKPCSTPFENVPNSAKIITEIKNFLNPKESASKEVSGEEVQSRRAR